MNLYLVSRTGYIDCDSYGSFIVAAPSEDDAKATGPNGNAAFTPRFIANGTLEVDPDDIWTKNPDEVTVKLLGTAIEGMKESVILASFFAG